MRVATMANGSARRFSEIGGYPLVYVYAGEYVCPDCALGREDDPDAGGVNEYRSVSCSECGKRIEGNEIGGEFNRMDIVEAHYLYCVLNHGGMGSPLYARLSRITGRMGFSPRRGLNGPENLTDNGRDIFDAICL